jgi:nucleotide-binding universal stress UspA family protein
MLPFKKILCPTDFSDPSYEALHVANEMASHFSSELCLVNIVDMIPTIVEPVGPVGSTTAPVVFNTQTYREELERYAKTTLERLIKEQVSERTRVRSIVGYGNAADEILRIAEEEDVDLIVIATHGRTGFKHLLFGSVAEKVVRQSAHPVLTIRAPKKED